MITAEREHIINRVKELLPNWVCEATSDDFTLSQDSLKIRLLNIELDKYEDFHSRILVSDTDITDGVIFRKRVNISDDEEIDNKLFKPFDYVLGRIASEKKDIIPGLVREGIRGFDHAMHRLADEGSRTKMVPIGDFLKTLPESKPLVEGLINQGEIIMFFGPTNAGMTTLLLNLAACCVSGKDFLDFTIPKPLRVGYWDFENPPSEMETRIKKLSRRYPGFDKKLLYFREFDHKIGDVGGEATLKNIIKDHELDILIPDNLSSFKGSWDENSPDIVDPVMVVMSNVAAATGCAIVFPHHTKKETRSHGGKTSYPDEPRGHTEIEGKCDSSFRYVPTDEKGQEVSLNQRTSFGELKSRKKRAIGKKAFQKILSLNSLNNALEEIEKGESQAPTPDFTPDQIRALRKESGMTQAQFAERLNTTKQSVIRWETGKSTPHDEYRRELFKLSAEIHNQK